jgi:hypothetical protein
MLGVKFLMTDGESEIACRINKEVLRYRFGSCHPASDVDAFRANRNEIERAASLKYDAGKIECSSDATVVVLEEDLASPLSKKMGA